VAEEERPSIWVLAGTNGAGKSSVGGVFLRQSGTDYYNPDEAARRISKANPALSQHDANALAWREGVRQLQEAIRVRREHFFETTLGGNTIVGLLEEACREGIAVRIWYAGLASVDLHIARVAARVARGGHDIPEEDVRRRYVQSRLNLIRLLPHIAELQVYDNSGEAASVTGAVPPPRLVLHWEGGKVRGPSPRQLSRTPDWAKPIVAAALKLARVGTK